VFLTVFIRCYFCCLPYVSYKRYNLILSGVCDVSNDELQEVLSSVKILGKTRIVDKRPDLTSKTEFVLIQTWVDVTKHTLPDQMGVPGEVGPWPIHVISVDTEKQTDFQAKLISFLEHEGKSMSDIKGLVHPNPSSLDVNTALIHAISSLVDKCNATPADIQSYRKLRMFSGVRPTPSGEEEYDAWTEQTTHMLDEWQCSDSTKKQRVVESLKGPAADIIRFLRAQNPNATANDYMQALETAFGTTETSSDLLVKFRNTFQSEGEKLSTFLLRLDKLLHCIFRKGGLQLADMNRLRVEQVVRGALPHDMIAMRIRMTHKLRPPLSFNDLLKEVREEEDMLQSRTDAKSVAMSKPIVATVATAAAQTDVQSPKLDNATKNRYQRNKPGIFCYRCGEDGHYMRECDGVENLQRVNKRLIRLAKKSGNYHGFVWNQNNYQPAFQRKD
uniref:CCHC-type domain-containing protein n=1 Tax=Acanthochromis polyacanthus TaxID=80966 RepID=A0A3Q1FH27_9TELE